MHSDPAVSGTDNSFRSYQTLGGKTPTILDEGAEKGIFIQTLPIIVHLMVVGAFSFYKTGWPIRTRLMSIPDDLKQIDTQVSGKIATEIEKLILKAVKK
jgi:ABC-type long-subunit fatty acid transport system fused permease/ATPase subunit